MKALLMVFAMVPMLAQDPPGFAMWKTSELNERAKSAKADATGMAGGGIGNLEGYQAIVVRRDKTGEAEIHEKMIDIMIVTDGEATLKVGGTVAETRPNATAGEIRGKSLVGSVDKKIGPGDTIYLPAGTAHWVVLPEGKSITYLLLKLDKK